MRETENRRERWHSSTNQKGRADDPLEAYSISVFHFIDCGHDFPSPTLYLLGGWDRRLKVLMRISKSGMMMLMLLLLLNECCGYRQREMSEMRER